MTIIEMDTRNQQDSYVTKYFDKVGVKWIRNKLFTGDVKLLNSTDVIIDLKKDLLEVAGNLCNTNEHERVNREIKRAKEIGCKKFIFLVKDKNIKSAEDIKNWHSPHSQVKGSTLLKIMTTMKERYGVQFIFTNSKNAGEVILELLDVKINKN